MTARELGELERTIARQKEQIASLQRELALNLNKLEDARREARAPAASEKKKKKAQGRFLTLDDGINMGLYNKPCPAPYAKCGKKNVNLSYADVRRKGCVLRRCPHLTDLDPFPV